MKLFIENKQEFTDFFDAGFWHCDKFRQPLTSSEIHKLAFGILSKNVNIDNSIPLSIFTKYDNKSGLTVFNFKNKKNDIYFYEFKGVVPC